MNWRALTGIWLDVGAFRCDHTYGYALFNPSLRVYAFEPNLQFAAKLFDALPNISVVPMAVAEQDGCAEFNITAYPGTSSLLPIDLEATKHWKDQSLDLRTVRKTVVPTIRLDTFLRLTGIDKVDYMKIDAQGTDLAVVRSAGDRLKDFRKIYLEVYVTPYPLYRNAPTKPEIIDYMRERGFELTATDVQSDGQEENLTFENRR